MRNLLTMAVLAASALAAHADSFSYKGVKLGDTIEQFKQALPQYECTDTSCTYIRDSCARVSGLGSSSEYSRKLDECREGTSFGGALVTYGRAEFIDGALAKLYITSPWMTQLNDALTGKFGAPTSVDNTPVRNKMGTEFPNWIKTWVLGTDVMVVSQRASKVNEGSVLISGPAAQEQARTRRQEQIKAGAKDF